MRVSIVITNITIGILYSLDDPIGLQRLDATLPDLALLLPHPTYRYSFVGYVPLTDIALSGAYLIPM